MADIHHDFPIRAPADAVFDAVSTPAGLDRWWTLRSAGSPRAGDIYQLFFGDGYDWRARVSACEPGRLFELEMTEASPDWRGSRVRFELEPGPDSTAVRFSHTGWPEANEHYRVSCYCWAMYLRLMRRAIETGEVVPYASRLDA